MIYFDNAATSRFKPNCVKKAIADSLRHSANPGRSSHKEAIRGAMIVENTRERLLRYVQAKQANVIFTKNCTEALNLAVLGTARLGGHVVTTTWEHNSVLRPLNMLKKEGVISLTVLEGFIDENKLLSAINDKTYLVAVTAMSNVTGYEPPLEMIGEICAAKGVKLLVDGAQSLGHRKIDFDKLGIDLLCGAGHKSLYGIMGTGFLIYQKRIFVNPLLYGGTGTESTNLYQPANPPESLESGTLNLPGIVALGAGLKWTEKHFDEINENCKRISLFLHRELENDSEIFSIAGSPILSFRLRNLAPSVTADLLDSRYGIATRSGLHCAPLAHKALGTNETGLVRISIGCNNGMRDAKRLVKAIKELSSEKTE